MSCRFLLPLAHATRLSDTHQARQGKTTLSTPGGTVFTDLFTSYFPRSPRVLRSRDCKHLVWTDVHICLPPLSCSYLTLARPSTHDRMSVTLKKIKYMNMYKTCVLPSCTYSLLIFLSDCFEMCLKSDNKMTEFVARIRVYAQAGIIFPCPSLFFLPYDKESVNDVVIYNTFYFFILMFCLRSRKEW